MRDWSVRVARGADAAPVAVEVTVTLPGVRSAGDADLEVTERYVRVRFGEESRVVALPVAVDPGTATAAFKKKTKTLAIKVMRMTSQMLPPALAVDAYQMMSKRQATVIPRLIL